MIAVDTSSSIPSRIRAPRVVLISGWLRIARLYPHSLRTPIPPRCAILNSPRSRARNILVSVPAIPRDHPLSLSLGNCRGGLVGRNAFYPGGVDTFYDVVIRQTSLD